MRTVLLAAIAAFGVLLDASSATAGNIYLGAFGGATFPDDADVDSTVLDVTVRGHQEFDPGFVVGGAVGYRFDFGLRLEGEVAYRHNDYDLRNNPSPSGDLGATSVMANAWYDFDTGSAWHPFIGGGIGVAMVDVHDAGLGTDSDAVFAFQAGTGVAYDLTESIALVLEYRFFAADNVTVDHPFEIIDTVPISVRHQFDYHSHNVMFGIQVNL